LLKNKKATNWNICSS